MRKEIKIAIVLAGVLTVGKLIVNVSNEGGAGYRYKVTQPKGGTAYISEIHKNKQGCVELGGSEMCGTYQITEL
jgi:hypothetical protein